MQTVRTHPSIKRLPCSCAAGGSCPMSAACFRRCGISTSAPTSWQASSRRPLPTPASSAWCGRPACRACVVPRAARRAALLLQQRHLGAAVPPAMQHHLQLGSACKLRAKPRTPLIMPCVPSWLMLWHVQHRMPHSNIDGAAADSQLAVFDDLCLIVWPMARGSSSLTCALRAAVQKPTEAALINQFEQTTGGSAVETSGSVTFQQVRALLAGMAAGSKHCS